MPLAHLCTSLPGIVSSSQQRCKRAVQPRRPPAPSSFPHLDPSHSVTPSHTRRGTEGAQRPRGACLPDSLSINWPRSNRNVGRAILALCQPPGATFCLLLTSKYGGAELAAPEGRKGRDAPATEREKPPFVPFFFQSFPISVLLRIWCRTTISKLN